MSQFTPKAGRMCAVWRDDFDDRESAVVLEIRCRSGASISIKSAYASKCRAGKLCSRDASVG